MGAITHDARNYVVNAEVCNLCMACISPCPTGSIDNWRTMLRSNAYSVEAQLEWEELPAELADVAGLAATAGTNADAGAATPSMAVDTANAASQATPAAPNAWGASVPPWSAAHAYTQLYGLDFGSTPMPVLEGQSIGIVPPGTDASGRPHHARQYSIASPRNGERPGYNNLSLTVKRVLEDHQGNAVRGVASNYLCDLNIGDSVHVIGPFGSSFLMPNHPRSHIVMICTGTGSAPMRAMTEWRRRQRANGTGNWAPGHEPGKLMLFFGARTQEELPYFGPLQKLPKDFIDTNFAFSRTPGQPKRYVQDAMRERAKDLLPLLADQNSHFYVCGLKSMEAGVLQALRDIASAGGLDWQALGANLQREGRLHLETY